jgi:hypothetical protein
MAFLAALIVVKPFVRYVARNGFAPLRGTASWSVCHSAGDRRGMAVMQWLRRSFLAGFFVTVPLMISVFALVWIFGIIDGFTAPVARWALGSAVSESGPLRDYVARFAGVLLTLLVVLTVRCRDDERHRPASAGTSRELADDDPGIPDHLRAGEAARGGVLARQRDGIQARRDGG